MKRRNHLPVWLLLVTLFMLSACASDESDDSGDDDDSGNVDDDTGSDDDDSVGADDDTNEIDDDTSGMDDDTVSGDDDDSIDTWMDSSSGLTWQLNPTTDLDWLESQNGAEIYCNNLYLDGYNDWHLPTISELRSLIRGCEGTESNGYCGVTDSCLDLSCYNDFCSGCPHDDGPASGCYWPSQIQGPCYWYMSSSVRADNPDTVWKIGFEMGEINDLPDMIGHNPNIRCVR